MAIRYFFGEGILVSSGSSDLNVTSSTTPLFYIGTVESNDKAFQILIPSGSTGENVDTTALFITSSGKDPFVGIGTTKPESLLEIKSTQTSSKGLADLVLAVPNASVSKGNESSRISFVIEDQTLSGSEFTISGSTGAIFSRVLT